ncbi:MAG: hypothetical protein AAGB97_05085 [Dehalococcoidia bacterium]
MTHVTVIIRNPAEAERTWEGLFLIDAGAVDCVVPGKYLRDIGLNPKARRTYELADGSEVKMDITTGEIEFMGDLVGSTIIFGASLTLDIASSLVDPQPTTVIPRHSETY